jgi:hypothetical protein
VIDNAKPLIVAISIKVVFVVAFFDQLGRIYLHSCPKVLKGGKNVDNKSVEV